MNKKFIAVLLIIGFILTGLSSINAADNITSVADNNNDESISDSLTDENVIDESATDESIEDDKEDTVESDGQKIDEKLDERLLDLCAQQSEWLFESDDESMQDIIEGTDRADMSEVMKILNNKEDYNQSDLTLALYNSLTEVYKTYQSICNLTDKEGELKDNYLNLLHKHYDDYEGYNSLYWWLYEGLYSPWDILYNLLELDDVAYKYVVDSIDEAKNMSTIPPVNDTDSNQATTGDDSSVSKDTNSVVKNTRVSNNNQNNIISKIISPFANFKKDNSHMSVYEIYHNLLEKYLAGEITFDQLKKALEDAGIDTTDLKLNEDNSITFLGETSPVPEKLASDNQAATNSTQDENQTSE